MKTLLTANNISKTYKKTGDSIQVLKSVNLSIYKGEIVALMGPSGSGKSTLMNILGTLDLSYFGEICIDGVEISSHADLNSIRSSKLGFVFQFHHLLPEFTIIENLEIPGLINNGNGMKDDEKNES